MGVPSPVDQVSGPDGWTRLVSPVLYGPEFCKVLCMEQVVLGSIPSDCLSSLSTPVKKRGGGGGGGNPAHGFRYISHWPWTWWFADQMK